MPNEPRERVTPEHLRGAFHGLIRAFGLLEPARTPCGQPLAVSHAHALMELVHASAMKQGDLAAALGLSKSAVSRMVAQLERRGWVERESDADDGRVRRLTLTARGRRVAKRVDRASIERFSSILAELPASTRAQAVRVLRALQGAIPSRDDDGSKGKSPR